MFSIETNNTALVGVYTVKVYGNISTYLHPILYDSTLRFEVEVVSPSNDIVSSVNISTTNTAPYFITELKDLNMTAGDVFEYSLPMIKDD